MASLRSLTTVVLAASALLGGALAHPGEEHTAEKLKREIEARDLAEAHARSAVAKCAGTSVHMERQARAAARRSLAAQLLREKRGIVHKPLVSKRDQVAVEKWMGVCHDQSGAHGTYDMSTPEAAIFTSNATHALTPETIIGPYFVAGEYIRSDVTEEEPGVPIHLDIQFIDINSCESVPNMLVDIWHANATGVYSGVVGSGGLNTTFLRGIQVTDHDGVVQFDSIYPGHYFGRTQHIHVVSRRGGKILGNGTYSGGVVNHIGQLYFDQELNDNIRGMEPYRNNWMPLTTNRADFLTAEEATPSYDPFVQYVALSDDARDGLLMWITIGINATADYNKLAFAAATWKEGGGVASPPQRFPFPPPNGTNGTNITGMPPMPFPPPGGFPGFPTSSAKPSQATPQPWGPCNS